MLNIPIWRRNEPFLGLVKSLNHQRLKPQKKKRNENRIPLEKNIIKSVVAVSAGLFEELESLRETCEGVQYRLFFNRGTHMGGTLRVSFLRGYFDAAQTDPRKQSVTGKRLRHGKVTAERRKKKRLRKQRCG